MPEHTDIIKRPIVTEKSTNEINKVRKIRENGQRVDGDPLNRYTFEVARDARKPEIKAAVEAIYGVRVTKVRTQTRPAPTWWAPASPRRPPARRVPGG